MDTPKVQLSSHVREYSAYPIQTRLQDGRFSIIIDPGSVGNLCGDRWAREVALMARANGQSRFTNFANAFCKSVEWETDRSNATMTATYQLLYVPRERTNFRPESCMYQRFRTRICQALWDSQR